MLADDPPAELLNATSEMITLRVERLGVTGGTAVTQSGGVFEIAMRDVDLRQAMFLLAALASSGLPVPLELIDVRAERSDAEGER